MASGRGRSNRSGPIELLADPESLGAAGDDIPADRTIDGPHFKIAVGFGG
jgi:hypothetical protein